MKKITWASIAGTILLIACTPISEPDLNTAIPSSSQAISETKATVSETPLIKHPLCLYGCPLGADEINFLVDHTIFLLSTNRETKFADWVAYQIKANNLSGGTHDRDWQKDPDIPTQFTLVLSDYEGANTTFQYDRGHQAPLADFSNHPAWPTTNYLSNVTPQKADLNRRAWAALERKERALAKQVDTVYVITGTIYLTDMPALPNAALPHRVPSGYWKVIAVLEENKQLRLASFFLDQATPRDDDVCEHSTSLQKIEELTGFAFFVNYPFNDTTSLLADLGGQASEATPDYLWARIWIIPARATEL